jgi:type I restriction enzyme, S subunit
MSDNQEMPNGWEIVKVDFIGNLLRGITYKKNDATAEPKEGYLPILRANNINGELNFSDLIHVPKKYVEDEQIIKIGDIVFAMSSGSKHLVGKSAVARHNFDGSYGAFCSLLRVTDAVNKKFISYIFKGNAYRKLISEIAKGTNINNLKREHILDFEISLPPLPEQYRIVAKIEELFSSLDKGIESLKTAQQQLKIYRQAVLKWAFEGKLTNENVKEELPEGWNYCSLKDLKEFSIYGPRFSSKDYSENGVAVLRTTDISERGKVDWENSPKLNLSEIDYDKYKLKKNDLLITRTGSIGRLSVFNDSKRAIPGAFLIHYRLKGEIDIWYIFYFLKSEKAQKHFKEYSFGVGRPNLNVPNIELLQIPIPAIDEQHAIVSEIESRLSVCDKIEESIEQSLKQAESLRQSILKKAFEGKLVPQDPSDEPASVLLARIKAEKEKNKPKNLLLRKTGRTKKATA